MSPNSHLFCFTLAIALKDFLEILALFSTSSRCSKISSKELPFLQPIPAMILFGLRQSVYGFARVSLSESTTLGVLLGMFSVVLSVFL